MENKKGEMSVRNTWRGETHWLKVKMITTVIQISNYTSVHICLR